jgi:hypothetical protein
VICQSCRNLFEPYPGKPGLRRECGVCGEETERGRGVRRVAVAELDEAGDVVLVPEELLQQYRYHSLGLSIGAFRRGLS